MRASALLARLACLLPPLALGACGQAFFDGRALRGGLAGQGNDWVGSTTGGNGNNTNPNIPSPPASSSGCASLGSPLQVGAAGTAVPFGMAVSNGLPSVTWGSTRVYYSAWNGTAWAGLSQSDTAGIADSSSPAGLTIDSGKPYLAFVTEAGGNGTLYLYSYGGGQWTAATPQPFNDAAGTVNRVDVTLGNGVASMTWQHGTTTNLLRQGLSVASTASAPLLEASNAQWVRSLAVSNANEVVVWSDGQQAFAGRYDGAADITPFGTSNAVSPANAGVNEPVAAALMANGNPVIAWQDSRTGTPAIYVMSFDGTRWVGMGASGSAGGLTPKAESHRPALALDAQGRPWVAWEDTASKQVYLQAWTGTAWAAVALPAGDTASGMGVSGGLSQGMSAQWPQLGFTAQGKAILGWYEASTQVRVCTLP